MKIFQIEDFFTPLKDIPCPITEKLVKSGYQQKSGGYIKYARLKNMIIDHKRAMPSQSWHLLECYCPRAKKKDNFTKQVQCGELIFWMAEVSESVNKSDLIKLAEDVLIEPNNRRRGNKLIQDMCFDKIIETVEKKQRNDIEDNAFSSMYSITAFIISLISIFCDLLFDEVTKKIIVTLALIISFAFCTYYEKNIINGVSSQSKSVLHMCHRLNFCSRKIGYLGYILLAVSYII